MSRTLAVAAGSKLERGSGSGDMQVFESAWVVTTLLALPGQLGAGRALPDASAPDGALYKQSSAYPFDRRIEGMSIDGEHDVVALKRVGAVVAEARDAMASHVAPGVTTAALDAVGRDVLRRHGARSAPQLAYR